MYFIKLAAILVFLLAYFLIIRYYDKKAKIAGIGVFILLLLAVISPIEALKAINWNVLGIYFGMLFIIEAMVFSRFPDFLAISVVNHSKNVSTVLILVAIFSGIMSVVVENVAVVLIMAPIALAITRRLKISPVPILIAIAVSANLQGVATLIGDPPSMLMAGFAKFTFNDFFFYNGKPSLFFAVQIGAIASLFVLYLFFKKYKHAHKQFSRVKPSSLFPALLLAALIIALSFSSYFDPGFKFMAGAITVIFGIIAVVWYYSKNKPDFNPMLKRVDWETGFFLAGVFILVESLTKVSAIQDAADIISGVIGHNLVLAYITIIAASLLLSAFIDNVPYIAAMLPVVQKLAYAGGFEPALLYFGLLIGASVGGNITPIGASANIVAMGIAKKEGYKTNFWDFVKIGLPFTLVSVAASSAFIYFMYG